MHAAEQQRKQVLLRTFFLLCLSIHALLFVVFLLLRIPVLWIYNILICGLYLANFRLLEKRHFLLPLQLAIFEIALHSIAASFLLGWTSYYGLYLMASVVIVFNSYSLNLKAKIVEVSLISTSFIALYILTGKGFCVFSIDSAVRDAIGLFNVVAVISSLTFLSLLTAKENDRLKKRLEEISELDELTGAYNRRFFNKYLDIEIKRNASHIKYHAPRDINFGLAMLDLDDFKRINDTHGHLEGDKVLSEVAQLIKSSLFERDILCRYGGEEFVILFTATPRDGAIFAVEKIRKLIEDHQVKLERNNTPVRITVSIGFASFNEASDIYKLLALADERVYTAKNNGKNRVISS